MTDWPLINTDWELIDRVISESIEPFADLGFPHIAVIDEAKLSPLQAWVATQSYEKGDKEEWQSRHWRMPAAAMMLLKRLVRKYGVPGAAALVNAQASKVIPDRCVIWEAQSDTLEQAIVLAYFADVRERS